MSDNVEKRFEPDIYIHTYIINVQGFENVRRTELQYVQLSLVPSRKRTTRKTSA